MGCGGSKATQTRNGNENNNSKTSNSRSDQSSYPTQPMKPVASVNPQPQQQHPPPQPPQQQQKQQPPPQEEKKEIKPADQPKDKPLSDEELKKKLARYMEIEKELQMWEGKNQQKSLDAKKEQLKNLTEKFQDVEKQYKAACEKVAKEKADVDKMQHPSVRSFFKDETAFNEKMSKEQEEYLEAVSEQEVTRKQYEDIQTQKTNVEKEIGEATKDVDKLVALYDEQDQILEDIFSGHYGSDLENKLEEQVDELLDRRERISIARYKWMNGRLLLQHACNQLAFATRRWQTLANVPPTNLQSRYMLATETRNNLIAATQNILNSKRYLNNIKFPYCEPEEVAMLERACTNVYIDMQTPDRHQHALQCYSVTHKRAAALLQWFDSVIHNTIEKDLAKAKSELTPKQKELRQERLKLIKGKIDGDTSDINFSDKGFEDMAYEYDDDAMEPELMAVSQPDKLEGDDGSEEGDGSEGGERVIGDGSEIGNSNYLFANMDPQAAAPTPLPLSELAPPPSQEDLFGDIEELRKQHEQQLANLEKAQETNKARMEQGLQEKLRQKRRLRRRMTPSSE